MSTTVRFLISGIAVVYLICAGAQFMSPNTSLISSQPFGVAVLLFLVVVVALHVAVVIAVRSWEAVILSVLSLAALAVLILVGLMKVTGDSL